LDIKTQKFILKLFSEIMVKGDKAKKDMINQLYNNLQTMLLAIDDTIDIKKFSDKIEVVTPINLVEKTKEILLNTPGIDQVLEALQFDNINSLDNIKQTVGDIVIVKLKDKTFVVRAKRTGSHQFNSHEIERVVGGYLLAKSQAKRVDLHNPDITVRLELINNQLNIITKHYKGLGGFPIGSGGDILSLMSGGFDSTVASYLTIKRGLKTHYIFFNLGGKAHEIGVKQVALYLWSKFASSHRVKFITIDFDEVVAQIFKDTPPSYMGIMLKRLMLQAAQEISNELEIDALLTGESVAQVSSQTLRNLALIDSATTKLVIRPLATTNKNDIINIAQQIGTKSFAENMPEYCGVISQNPVTHGSYKRLEKIIKTFDYSVLQNAIANKKIIYVDEIIDDITTNAPIKIVSNLEPNDIVIDIRSEEDILQLINNKVLKIPFYDLKKEFKKLNLTNNYLLYCQKGIMSQLHAQYLKDENIAPNIKVYRP
jgi:thiamine biosynthesis protein ThiI